MKPRFFETTTDFRRWLTEHHGNASELLVGFHKKESGRAGMAYPEALDEALAFGWIDGVRKSRDASTYTIRFTPRKRGSVWSVVNTKRIGELIKLRRMNAPGLRAFRERDATKTRRYSCERAHAKLDARLMRTLRASRKACAFFDSQPPGYKRITMFWVMSAKREETRARRLAHLIEQSESGERIDLLKPSVRR